MNEQLLIALVMPSEEETKRIYEHVKKNEKFMKKLKERRDKKRQQKKES